MKSAPLCMQVHADCGRRSGWVGGWVGGDGMVILLSTTLGLFQTAGLLSENTPISDTLLART